ncbi:MAG: hypothetical protein ACRDFZ_00820 [Candidatus Limnocylindria bacterium]
MTRPGRALIFGVPIAIVLAGCSLVSPAPQGGDGGIPHPAGSEVVVRIAWTGGFVPYQYHFTSLPRLTLLGDGRVLVEGPQIEIYPPPALPSVQTRRLTEEGIQSVLFRILETGLFDASHSYDAATQFIADANSTVFTVRADNREVVVDIYALGLLTDPIGAPTGVPTDELEAHDRLTALERDLMDLDAWIPADDWAEPSWQTYQPESLRLVIANIDDQPPDPDGLDAEPVAWPVGTDPDQFGTPSTIQDFRCGVVGGEEAAAWYAALSQANTLTRWSHDGHLYSVAPRPLLPDEPLDCGQTEG